MDSTRTFHDFVPRLNSTYASDAQDLYYVRLDDRGDLGCYVWTGGGIRGPSDATEEAEAHAQREGWEVSEDDVAVFTVSEEVFAAALSASAREVQS